MRRFSSATRFAYNRLLEGKPREELKRADGPLCTLFRLNTRYADGAIAKAKAVLDSALELGNDPKKVVFGGRGLFEQLKRKHLSGKPLEALFGASAPQMNRSPTDPSSPTPRGSTKAASRS